jgi:hypothetical protein
MVARGVVAEVVAGDELRAGRMGAATGGGAALRHSGWLIGGGALACLVPFIVAVARSH